jgi:hypothetical protein
MVGRLADVQYSVGELVLSRHFSPERVGTVNILPGIALHLNWGVWFTLLKFSSYHTCMEY